MTFKIMATIAAVSLAAAANCGCSAVPSSVYGASGQLAPGQVAPARAYAVTSPAVEIPGEQRVVGADPDGNVRFELYRNANSHLHPSGSN